MTTTPARTAAITPGSAPKSAPASPLDGPAPSHGRPDLLVIGAGPYGLATAAAAKAAGLDPLVLGEPMGFWSHNMPGGMLLRSPAGWQLDAHGTHTLTAYLAEQRINPADADPIPVELFTGYGEWFAAAKEIRADRAHVADLRAAGGRFQALLTDGRTVTATSVLAAPGVERFTRVPDWVPRSLPPGRYSHTCHLTRLDRLAGARCLIVGGRQSAFEWAALLAEHGAAQVHVVHRHDPPRFERSDWAFVEPMIDATLAVPGWFRSLPRARRDAIEQRFWAEGRLKLEPWLAPRLNNGTVRRWPGATVTKCRELPDGTIAADLSTGHRLHADHVILATGYAADLAKVPYLAGVLDQIEVADGFPVLDEQFQTSLPGLFITGFAATRDFGPFFGFVRGCPAAATLIAAALTRTAPQRRAPRPNRHDRARTGVAV